MRASWLGRAGYRREAADACDSVGRDPQHDFSKMFARLEQPVRLGRLREREDAIHDRSQRARLEIESEARQEAAHDRGLLGRERVRSVEPMTERRRASSTARFTSVFAPPIRPIRTRRPPVRSAARFFSK